MRDVQVLGEKNKKKQHELFRNKNYRKRNYIHVDTYYLLALTGRENRSSP